MDDLGNMKFIRLDKYGLVLYLMLISVVPNECLHLHGSWESKTFYKFLDRFGFQQTDLHDKSNTQGYIYGNITSPSHNISNSMAFVVVDSEYFIEYYGNRSTMPRSEACNLMFEKIDKIAWDSTCNIDGKEDFLRKVPCPVDELCVDEDTPEWVIPGYQFTYRVQDTSQPRFWYISLVACSHIMDTESSCHWIHDTDNIKLNYDIWLVNGDPFTKHINPFEHQFSFEMHDVFEIYVAFLVLYSFVFPFQLYALYKQKHMLPIILTSCMGMEYIGILFNFVHVFKFAFDGEGVDLLKVVGNFIDNFAQCLFMLLLLLIVKGWTITRMDLPWRARVILFSVWTAYTMANLGLFVWNLVEVDVVSDTDEWQTWPGYLILTFRVLVMIWFLWEMRETFLLERVPEKHRFYLHFGAGFLVWFVYLPILALICSQISALWRYKTILSVMNAADFLSYCIMIHLLWPSRSYIYFNLKVEARIPMDDIEFSDLNRIMSSSEESLELHNTTQMNSRLSARIKREQFAASLQSSEEDSVHGRLLNDTPNGHCANDLPEHSNHIPANGKIPNDLMQKLGEQFIEQDEYAHNLVNGITNGDDPHIETTLI